MERKLIIVLFALLLAVCVIVGTIMPKHLQSVTERTAQLQTATVFNEMETMNSITTKEVIEVTDSNDAEENAAGSVWGESAIAQIIFSKTEYFYFNDISVELSLYGDNVENPVIYYTTDGAVPTKSNSEKYSKPIKIKASTDVKGYTLRAKAFWDNGESEVFTHTYFVSSRIDKRFDTLVVAVTVDPYDAYDYENGILIAGKLRDDHIESTGEKEPDPPAPANYNLRGRLGERPSFVEILSKDGTKLISQGAGLRVSGGWSRANTQKSLRLIARKSYDGSNIKPNGKFKYPLFEDNFTHTDSGVLISEYEEILLRNCANDMNFAFLRDELTTALAMRAGLDDTQHMRPAAVFLNGEYYGFAWIHTIYSGEFMQTVYETPDDNFQIVDLTDGYNPSAWGATQQAVDDWENMYSYRNKDLTNDTIFNELEKLLDIDNFLLYYAIEAYIDDRDWPSGNIKAYKYYPPDIYGSQGVLDGKWRYLLYDAEYAWGLYGESADKDTIARLLGKIEDGWSGPSSMLTALLNRDDIKEKFSNIILDIGLDVMNSDNVSATVDKLSGLMYKELRYLFTKKMPDIWGNMDNTINEQNSIKDFAKRRFAVLENSLKNLYGYSGEKYVINVEGAEGAEITLSTKKLVGSGNISGVYFTENKVLLTATPYKGFDFDYWLIDGKKYYSSQTYVVYSNNAAVKAELHMKKVPYSGLIINEVSYKGGNDWIEIYNPTDKDILMKGYYLSTEKDNLQKFAFKTLTVKQGGYLYIVCKDNKELGEIATNFNLKDGETLYLSNEEGNIISECSLINIEKNNVLAYNLSVGKYTSTKTPTPKSSNAFTQ